LSDTFAGIAPAGIIAFVVAQFIGMFAAVVLGSWLWRERVNSAGLLGSATPPRKEAEMM
jgi:ABC-type dipeptide/oligopeptide/nickel transport system permease component